MDLTTALTAHAEWKMKLRTAIKMQTTVDAETLSRDNCCAFGQWLHGEAKRKYGKLQVYTDCLANHAKFHSEAGKVATAINQKRFPQAEAALGLGSSYHTASNAVGVSIIQLRKMIAA